MISYDKISIKFELSNFFWFTQPAKLTHYGLDKRMSTVLPCFLQKYSYGTIVPVKNIKDVHCIANSL